MSKGQKFLLFLVVFMGTVGVISVDAAYSDMMDREGMLTLSLRRVDDEYIKVSVFGRTEEINGREVAEKWENVSDRVAAALDSASSSVRELLGLSDEGADGDELLQRVVFPVETL